MVLTALYGSKEEGSFLEMCLKGETSVFDESNFQRLVDL